MTLGKFLSDVFSGWISVEPGFVPGAVGARPFAGRMFTAGEPARRPRALLGHAARRAPRRTLSKFNFSTITAFLAWFGGTGYLLQRYTILWTLVASGAGRR